MKDVEHRPGMPHLQTKEVIAVKGRMYTFEDSDIAVQYAFADIARQQYNIVMGHF